MSHLPFVWGDLCADQEPNMTVIDSWSSQEDVWSENYKGCRYHYNIMCLMDMGYHGQPRLMWPKMQRLLDMHAQEILDTE